MHTMHIIGSKTMGGAERFFVRLIHGLASMGHKTEAVVRSGYEVSGCLPDGVKRHEIPMRSVWDPISRLGIKRLIQRQQPLIVQTYMGRATRLTHIRVSKGPVHVARLGGYYKLKNFVHAHAWIGNTRGICDYLVRAGFPAKRVFHINNFIEEPPAVPLDQLKELRKQLSIPDDAYVLLTAGRFVEVKGHFELLKAFAMAPGKISERPLFLIMLGNGPLEPELKKLAGQLDISSRVIWPGWKTRPEPYFQLADLVIFSSKRRETLGNVILEAWAARRPVISTKFRGALEISVHGGDIWQAECDDPASLAHGIERLLKDEELMASLAENGYKKVLANFSKEEVLSRYLELYERLCHG